MEKPVYLETREEAIEYLHEVIKELEEDDSLSEYEYKQVELQQYKDLLFHLKSAN